jgi:uncharacterized membrane protein YadS
VHDSFSSARTHAPGLLVCGAVALGALALERLEVRLAGHAWVEALVLAILAGTAVRTRGRRPRGSHAASSGPPRACSNARWR